MTCMKYVQKHFWREHLCALHVFLCALTALVPRPVCAQTCAQLRGNIGRHSQGSSLPGGCCSAEIYTWAKLFCCMYGRCCSADMFQQNSIALGVATPNRSYRGLTQAKIGVVFVDLQYYK